MYELPKLPYEHNALEPFMDAKTLEIHHGKHHQAYTDKLNKALEKYPELLDKSIEDTLSNPDSIPEDIRKAVVNNGGGYYNHSFFWSVLSPSTTREPGGELLEQIISYFGSFEEFKKKFTEMASTYFGSGWTWLVKKDGKLDIISTPNQDCPISFGSTPLLTIDLWEHAYYLKYQNRRPEYIENWWNIVNWEQVEKNLNQ